MQARTEMTDKEFDLWAELLHERTGMELPNERKSFLITSLGLRMKEIGVGSYEEYYGILNSGVSGEVEWKFLIDRLTVHETRFFRHGASLKFVREFVLGRKPDKQTGNATIHVWSAGCSTGEEAYTLAMTIEEAIREKQEACYYGIMATDISLPSIKHGRRGVYNERRVRGVDGALLARFFNELEDGRFEVKKDIRSRVCFAPMNVLEPSVAVGKMDIIVCQNVLIYFDRGRRLQIVDMLAEHLNPGGLLILGSGELLNWGHPAMKKLKSPDTLAFRRTDAAAE